MPTIDESQEQRQTFGNAPGWAQGQRATPPEVPVVPLEVPDGASPAPDVEAVPSTAEPQPSGSPETAPPQPAVAPEAGSEVPFHQHPRWIERQQELERLRQELAESRRLSELAVQKIQPAQPPTVLQEDPWAGLVNHPDPVTAQFYQQQQRLLQHEARKMVEAQGQLVLQTVDAGRRELAAIKISQFRRENPDIKPGSPEETQIAGLVQQGYDLETAKKLTVYDRLESENRALKSKQASVPAKRAAATTEASSGIPQTAGLPTKPGDWRERVGAVIDAGGSFKDAANAIFGGPKR